MVGGLCDGAYLVALFTLCIKLASSIVQIWLAKYVIFKYFGVFKLEKIVKIIRKTFEVAYSIFAFSFMIEVGRDKCST